MHRARQTLIYRTISRQWNLEGFTHSTVQVTGSRARFSGDWQTSTSTVQYEYYLTPTTIYAPWLHHRASTKPAQSQHSNGHQKPQGKGSTTTTTIYGSACFSSRWCHFKLSPRTRRANMAAAGGRQSVGRTGILLLVPNGWKFLDVLGRISWKRRRSGVD
jgi:hypothetical protein